jgi:hypothetical protein
MSRYVTVTMLLCTATAVHGSTMNGVCNEDLCVCVVKGSETCPDWMTLTTEGGPYDNTGSSSCSGTDMKNAVCSGYRSDIFTEFPNVNLACSINEDGSPVITNYQLEDGNSTTAQPLLNYTENDPIPDCAADAPFTLVPSSAPTISPAPTPSPTSSATDVKGLTNVVMIAASLAGIVGMLLI